MRTWTKRVAWTLGTALAIACPVGLAAAKDETAPQTAAPLPASSPALSPAQAEAVAAAKARAKLLWLYDQAAWHTTDVMLAQQKRAGEAEQAAMTTVRGWVVSPDAKGWLVVYYAPAATEGDKPTAVFSAIWTGKGDKVVDAKWLTTQSYAWSAEQLAMVQAAALVSPPMLNCSRANLNRVVMPDPAVSGQILVYYMTPQERAGDAPFGRHSRTTVRDGAIVDRFNATKGCIIVPTIGPDGKSPPLIGVTNLTTETPTEFHLFVSRLVGLPVVTMDGKDAPNFVVGWKKDEPFVEPLSGLQDLDKFID